MYEIWSSESACTNGQYNDMILAFGVFNIMKMYVTGSYDYQNWEGHEYKDKTVIRKLVSNT